MPRTPAKPISRATRAHLSVASLNIRGHGGQLTNLFSTKWNDINNLMRDKKIGALAVQEAHLDTATCRRLNETFGRRLHVFCSPSPISPQAQGVAWVLNREITNTTGATVTELIAGRAILLSLPWHKSLTMTLLNVYAPNSHHENAQFWTTLRNLWSARRLPRPDVLLGDFNLTIDPLDRLPQTADPPDPTTQLRLLCQDLRVHDGWRATYPSTRDYTFLTPHHLSQSRLDRIYVSHKYLDTAADWTIAHTSVPTDHKLVSVKLSHRQLPFIGKGRWTLPLFILDDLKFINFTTSKLHDLHTGITTAELNPSADKHTPHLLYQNFKRTVRTYARTRTLQLAPKLPARILALKKDLHDTLNSDTHPTPDEATLAQAALLQQRILDLETLRRERARTSAAARAWTEGETISRYWSQVNKPKHPRDIIYSLRLPDTPPNQAETRSDRMASLARNYHNSIQQNDLPPPSQHRSATFTNITSDIDTQLSTSSPEWESLNSPITASDLSEALKRTENFKAPGLDGIPYELWKTLQQQFDALDDQAKASPQTTNPMDVLAAIFNNIRTHGLPTGSDFAHGWMCPIYKKKERDIISNYRPITVLNADYKLFTKALTDKLLLAIPHLVHPNQAGFIPQRSISDQTQLATLLLHYGAQCGERGALIALDQEKAYDRIAHDYLWHTLSAFNLPPSFISTVQHLYANANTLVIINGVSSTTYRVTRGVRQGDPLSCPLFDLAIEPMACMLRRSPLRGFSLPGLNERILTSLFADDTSVYLSKHDDFSLFERILTRWCQASTAKFNHEKTVLIPIGPPTYRARLLRRRRLNKQAPPLPPSLQILADGEATRLLGAWIGNNADPALPWSKVIDNISRALTRWNQFRPSLKGKRLIVQMVVGGMSQYLTKVNGMPSSVEYTLTELIRNLIHGYHKKPHISYLQLCQPLSAGGLQLLYLPARNEAIDLTWLRTYLDLSPSRPPWAAVADILIGHAMKKLHGTVPSWIKLNTFLQTWSPNLHSTMYLPPTLNRMLKAAKTYHATFDAAALSRTTRRALPIWFHIGAKPHFHFFQKTQAALCLQTHHHILSVGDLIKVTRRLTKTSLRPAHRPSSDCPCRHCRHDRSTLHCLDPHRCADLAQLMLTRLHPKWDPSHNPPPDGLSLTKQRHQHNNHARTSLTDIIFDPTVTLRGHLAEGFRIFTDPSRHSHLPAHRPPHIRGLSDETTRLWTDGSCTDNGLPSARAGSGIWYDTNDPRNQALRVPGPAQSNQTAEIYAIIVAAATAPPFSPLYISSDSRYCIEGLTIHLTSWEAAGWIGVSNARFFRAAAYHLRCRGAPTYFTWIKGHSNDLGNDGADALAAHGATLETASDDYLIVPREFSISGAKLSTLTQSLAYTAILLRNPAPPRESSSTFQADLLTAFTSSTGQPANSANLWKSLRLPEFSRTVSDFLWKSLHLLHKCGPFWAHFLPERAPCPTCNTLEDLDHILFRCEARGQNIVWDTISSLWSATALPLPPISLPTVLGCGLYTVSSPNGNAIPSRTRLLRILLSEAAYLIWRLRCDRVIGHASQPHFQHSPTEILAKLRTCLASRLNMDTAISRRVLSLRRAPHISPADTWTGLIHNEEHLPADWYIRGDLQLRIKLTARPPRPPV